MLELTKLRRNINVLIEPHPLSPQDLEKESSGIGQAIKNHGILIY